MKTAALFLAIAAIIFVGCIHVTVIKTTPEQAKDLSTNAPALKAMEKK